MRTYRAEYYQSGKIVYSVDFEVKNRKEAVPLAQYHKTHSPEIPKMRRIRTYVRCLTLVLKKVEKLINKAERIQKNYIRLRSKGKIDRIDFLEDNVRE